MKRLFLLPFLLLMASLQAQTITVSGAMMDINGNRLANEFILIQAEDLVAGFSYMNFLFTDANGDYTDVFSTTAPMGGALQNLDVTLSWDSCGTQTVLTFQNVTANILQNLISCAGGGGSGCSAHFLCDPDPLNPLRIDFAATTPGLTYTWDFGDGTTGSGQRLWHTYAASGTYTVCLMTDDGNGCMDTLCMTSFIGGGNPGGGGGCDATFNIGPGLPGSLGASFTAVNPFQMTYNWDFGDGNTGTGTAPFHLYTTAGTYTVCLTVTDSSCLDSSCMSITIGSVFPPAGCSAAFFNYPDSANVLNQNFVAADLGLVSYSWDFGDGTTGTGATASHLYASTGTYTACLIVTDTSCTDTVCYPVIIGGTPGGGGGGCAYFVTAPAIITVPNSLEFFGPVFTSASATYAWDFGDGNTQSGTGLSQVIHTYATAGTYYACLAVNDGQGCIDTFCTNVVTNPGGSGGGGFPIFGLVTTGTTNATDFTAFLILHDSTAGTLTAIDTMVGDSSGMFFFNPSTAGDYLIKVALNAGDGNYASYLPTYYGDELLWSNATLFNATAFPLAVIDMVAGTNLGGPGFVGGLISAGANKVGDPLENIHVLLLDANDNPVTYAVTNAAGEFSFSNLAYGTYKIWVEAWGRTADPYTVTIGPGNASVTGVKFAINDTRVTFLSTGLEDLIDPIAGIKTFPNPADKSASLSMSLKKAADMNVTVRDITGRTVYQATSRLTSGNQNINVPTAKLQAGVYLISLSLNGEQLPTQKLMIRH